MPYDLGFVGSQAQRGLHAEHHNRLGRALDELMFNIKDPVYGALGVDTDDTVAINLAFADAVAAGGGRVFAPAGTYRVSQQGAADGLAWALAVLGDNITFEGVGPSSVIRCTTDTTVLAVDGSMAAAGAANWHDHWVFRPTVTAHPLYAISAAVKGASSVTLTTVGDAANFAVGDYIVVRAGQTITTTSEQPDSEINVVTGIAGAVLSLEQPLAKAYAAENYPVGHASAGSPAPFGVQNFRGTSADRALIRNFTMRNLRLEKETGGAYTYAMTNFAQADKVVIEDCEFESEYETIVASRVRDLKVRRNKMRLSNASWHWAASVDTGCTDAEIAYNGISSGGTAYIHVHEGAARIKVHDNFILNKGVSGEAPVVDIRARGYDIDVTGNIIVNAGTTGAAIFADGTTSGGLIARNNVYAPNLVGAAIAAKGTGWTVSDNKVAPNAIALGNSLVGPQQVVTFSAWLTPTVTSVSLGLLPYMFVVESTTVYVDTVFNSSGTDLVNVGQTSWGSNSYASAVDVSSTGLKTGTAFFPGAPIDVSNLTITATYTAGGTAPTTGKALVVVRGFIASEKP